MAQDDQHIELALNLILMQFHVQFCLKNWQARPLMLERKFHELLEQNWEASDMHAFYRVMAAAIQCTKSKPTSRPFH